MIEYTRLKRTETVLRASKSPYNEVMVTRLHENFMESLNKFLECESYWQTLVDEVAAQMGQSGQWLRWRSSGKASFECGGYIICDGCSNSFSRAFTISQHPYPKRVSRTRAYIVFHENLGLPADLHISLTLTDESVMDARALLAKWMMPSTTIQEMEAYIEMNVPPNVPDPRIAKLEESAVSNDYHTLEEVRDFVTQGSALPDPDDADRALENLAMNLIAANRFELAEVAANAIYYAYERSQALQRIGEGLAAVGKITDAKIALDKATQVARQLDESWQRGERLCRLGKAVNVIGEKQKAENIWDEAIEAARSGEDDNPQDAYDCGSVQTEIVDELAMAGFAEKAQLIAAAIKLPHFRNRALTELGKQEAE